jgi:cytoskeleton protein RodZ
MIINGKSGRQYAGVLGLAGELLKEKREALGVDIREVSTILKISSKYLSAIENDNFDNLPVAVYTIGYIRCYAKYLGVEAGPVIANFTSHLSSPKPSTIIPISSSTQKVSRYFYALLVVLAGLSVFAVYTYTVKNRTSAITAEKVIPSVKQNPAIPPAPVAIDNTPVSPVSKAADSVPNENKINEPVPAVADKNGHSLEIKSLDTVWMRISFENGKSEEVTLRAGASHKWEFGDTATLKVGNAGGIVMNFDGKDLGPLGKTGEVLTMTFPPN